METNREYRNLPIGTFELRAKCEDGSEAMNVRGYASTFEQYELFEEDGRKFYEVIEPTAFDECDMDDVVFRKDHEGTVFARTSNGALKLSIDKHGLLTDTDLSRTHAARAMYEEIQAGCYTQMSFAFIVGEDEITKDEDNNLIRRIKKIRKCFDVSPVTWPANPGTEIYARSRFDGAIEAEQEEFLKREKETALELAKAKARAIC